MYLNLKFALPRNQSPLIIRFGAGFLHSSWQLVRGLCVDVFGHVFSFKLIKPLQLNQNEGGMWLLHLIYGEGNASVTFKLHAVFYPWKWEVSHSLPDSNVGLS